MRARSLVTSLVVLLTRLAAPVGAQITRLEVSIPYEFTVGTRMLAAGQYLIHRPVPADSHVLGFRGNLKHQKAVVTTSAKTSEAPAADTELTFARYGDAYFLRSIRVRGAREFYELPMSKTEHAAAANGGATVVTLKVESR